MLLTIDIGNSRIKAGEFKNDKITSSVSFTKIQELQNFIYESAIKEIAICSVVPDKTEIISAYIKQVTGKNPFIISKEIKTNLRILYKTPETLGIDRLCSAEGAFAIVRDSVKFKGYNKNTYIISIDFGSATTINVIEFPGNFIGGLIAPGIEMMFNSLYKNTANLPRINTSHFISIIGDSTNASIASGVINSTIGMIEKTISYIRSKTYGSSEFFICLTGGNAERIIPHLNFEFIYEKDLVLFGIKELYEINKT